jgi:PhoH-like ATPase
MNKVIRVYDTSALLDLSDNLVLDETCYVSTLVVRELENIKTSYSKDGDVKARARQVIRVLRSSNYTSNVSNYAAIEKLVKKYAKILPDTTDSRILLEAHEQIKWYNEVRFYTGDLTLYMFAAHLFKDGNFSAHITGETSKKRFWDGYVSLSPTPEQWLQLYDETNTENFLGLRINEYAILKEEDKVSAICRWDGENYVQLGYKPIKSVLLGHIEPRNIEQKCYFDLLQNPNVPIVNCVGRVGSGKTFLATAVALDMIESGYYDKLIYVRNNFGVEDTKDPGALPGDLEEKLRPFLGPLIDIVGDEYIVDKLIEEGKVEQVHLGYLRGRSLKNCVVLVDESQNLTPGHVKMLISRMAENSKLIFCGDYSQADSKIFRNSSNGLLKMNERLQDNKLYGQIRLNKIERSEICRMADLLD